MDYCVESKQLDENIFVSVVVSAFNASGFIDRCIGSISKNRLDLFELVIVNDGSVDDTSVKIKKMLPLFRNYKFIDKPNSGLTSSLNLAVSMVSGLFIMRCDADDEMSQARVENAYNDYCRSEFDVRISLSEKISMDNQRSTLPRRMFRLYKPKHLQNILRFGNFLVHGSLLVRTSLALHNNYDTVYKVSQDYDFILRVLGEAKTLVYSRDVEYYFYDNQASISAKRSSEQKNTQLKIAESFFGSGGCLISNDNSTLKNYFLKSLKILLSLYYKLAK